MRRTNTIRIIPDKKGRLSKEGDDCARLWNEITYRRRQSYIDKDREFDWNTDKEYHYYKSLVGSATAQQIIRKNNNAWKSFFALKKLERNNKLPEHIKKVRMPGYRKDRRTGKRKPIVLVRNDCYKLEKNILKIPNGLNLKWKGKSHWNGKQCTLEIIYNDVVDRWYGYQPVEVEPQHQETLGSRTSYTDIGVIYPICTVTDNMQQPIAFSGKPLLADWWYHNYRIKKHQSELETVNEQKTSKQLKKLYRLRRLRFRNKVNKIVNQYIEQCVENNVGHIVHGNLKNIRDSAKFNRKADSMIHNFWSHAYLIKRIQEKAEDFGITVEAINECGTSSHCIRCGSDQCIKRGRLFKCKVCGLEAHRDVVGAENISFVYQNKGFDRGVSNRVVAHPIVLGVSPRL